jgi:predicted nucleotidyltransferase component of viral defense system
MINPQEIKKEAESQRLSSGLIFKEYLHRIILEYLFRKGLFSHLVFQGGTALKLVYKGVRYSEDLDFVLKRKNASFFNHLNENLKSLPSYIDKFIPFAKNPRLKSQKDTANFKRFNLILEVDFLSAKDRTQIEIANIASYSGQTIILKTEVLALNPAIVVETPQEILADKFLAFASRNYLKGRDLWDIYFILTTLHISIDKNIKKMLEKKISDYNLTTREFKLKFHKNLSLLEKRGVIILKEEMDKFLPFAYRNLFKTKYCNICKEELKILGKLLKEFKKR